MEKYFLVIFSMLSIHPQAQLTSLEKNRIDALFKSWNNKTSPGAALGVVKDGKLVYARGYGLADLEHNIPITDSTIFYIGSVSKQFVTMCILILEEQGKLGLDDRVQKYLPDFPDYGAPLTIRHFIHHTSGVRDNLTLWSLAGKDYLDHIDKEEMYQLIRRQKGLNFQPGEKYLYSNSCYFMLGLIIEKVSGESLNTFAQKNIFGPLGMQHTFFQDDNTRIIKNRAFSYVQENGQFKNQLMRYDLVGSGGIYSNIRDLFRWDQNFYHNKLGKASQDLIVKMHTEGRLNNGQKIGYAFAIQNGYYRNLRTVSHSGALASYRSYLLRFPDQKTSVIILGNVTPIPIDLLPYRVAEVVLEKQMAPPLYEPDPAAGSLKAIQNNFKAEHIQDYLGAFYSEELDVTYLFTEKDNQLVYSINYKKPLVLQAKNPDLFETSEGTQIRFERNQQNLVSGFSVNAGRVTNLMFKRKAN